MPQGNAPATQMEEGCEHIVVVLARHVTDGRPGALMIAASRDRLSERLGPGLLFGGAGILLYRTIALAASEARVVLKRWVMALTFVEMAIDVLTMIGSVRWWMSGSSRQARFPLRTGAASALLHAARVLVFVVGRTGRWRDVDVRPEYREDHDDRWTWPQVVFAGAMSVLGIIGVIVIWWGRRSRRWLGDL